MCVRDTQPDRPRWLQFARMIRIAGGELTQMLSLTTDLGISNELLKSLPFSSGRRAGSSAENSVNVAPTAVLYLMEGPAEPGRAQRLLLNPVPGWDSLGRIRIDLFFLLPFILILAVPGLYDLL
ncbi:hypothetical protein M426DRAFT_24818 [Hypoxylon sp. CI-4A]|nr:hypothetical protein M426DRAFT_24818 [Hypoxylon sp. CI-4A]